MQGTKRIFSNIAKIKFMIWHMQPPPPNPLLFGLYLVGVIFCENFFILTRYILDKIIFLCALTIHNSICLRCKRLRRNMSPTLFIK